MCPPIRNVYCPKCDLEFESITTSLSQKDTCPKCETEEVELKPGGYIARYNFKEPNTGVPSKRTYKKYHD